jgi:5,10-methylenetetrahydromethanopterin reductase
VKFGVEFAPYLKLDALVKLAKLVERCGFEQIWVCDHYHNRYVYPVLTMLALETRRVKLGPGVTNPYLSHPTVTATAVATINEISHGRALLGISAGDPYFLGTVGIEQRKPVTAVREATHLARELLAGNRVSSTGELFSCMGAGLRLKPANKIPIYIGGRKRRMLELAGGVADGALINASHPEDILECIEYINRGMRASGRKPEAFDFVAYLAVSVGMDAGKARDAARGVVAFVTSSAPHTSLERHGIGAEEVELIRRLLRAGKMKKARAAVTDGMIDAFSVCGPIDELAARVEELKRLGITRTVIGSPMGPEPAKAVQSIAKALL